MFRLRREGLTEVERQLGRANVGSREVVGAGVIDRQEGIVRAHEEVVESTSPPSPPLSRLLPSSPAFCSPSSPQTSRSDES